jgi:hypothetical protein
MSCFDHFPILISQLVLPTYADHDTVDAESRSRCRRPAHLPGFAKQFSELCSLDRTRHSLQPILYLSSR